MDLWRKPGVGFMKSIKEDKLRSLSDASKMPPSVEAI